MIEYKKIQEERVVSRKTNSQNYFLNEKYLEVIEKFGNEGSQQEIENGKNIKAAFKRRFPKKDFGKPSKETGKVFSQEFSRYFFKLLRRCHKDSSGKYIFARADNQHSWAPALSNNCKIHRDGCPLYCIRNTHNVDILEQRKINQAKIFKPKKGVDDLEKFNVWKRPDYQKEREKIFLCYGEAENCTFEPTSFVKTSEKTMELDEMCKKRISNEEWVKNKGPNFAMHANIFKEGSIKKASIHYKKGDFTTCLKILKAAFDLDKLRSKYDPKYKLIYEANLKAKSSEKPENDLYNRFMHRNEGEAVPDDWDGKNKKNLRMLDEVWFMYKAILDFEVDRTKEIKKIKGELTAVKHKKQGKESKFKLSKWQEDKYFEMFKSIMCPLR